jgi:membrane-associated phospholipid phosphatase
MNFKITFFGLLILMLSTGFSSFAQGSHDLDGKLDGALLGAGGVTFGLGLYYLGKTTPLTEADIEKMDPLKVNKFDRPTTKNWSTKAHKISDIALHTTFYSQFALILDKNSRDEAGTVGVMMLEAALINNGITNILKGTVKRSRPFTYNPMAPMEKKLKKNGRYSFFSGHASNSASYAFLTAKVFSDNNPGSKWNPFVWGAAVSVPALTSFLRVKAGKHFPTDVLVGYAVGATIGFLVPELHKL